MTRHNLTADEVRRMFEATDLAEANRIAAEIERERHEREAKGRCEYHGRVDCGRCKTEEAEAKE